MVILVGLVIGFAAGRLLWVIGHDVFTQPLLARQNYRGRSVPTAVGVLLCVSVLIVEAGRALASAAGIGSAGPSSRWAFVIVALGFGFLGLIDDLMGNADQRGFRGHLRALRQGRLTTGLLKLLGGGAVALIAVMGAAASALPPPLPPSGVGRLVADAAVVALAANLGNLFDRAPGRVIKISSLAFILIAVSAIIGGATSDLVGVAVVMGTALALMGGDLAERLMLGDAGANVLGATLGMSVVVVTGTPARTVVLMGLVGLNLVAEAISFSRVIDSVGLLRRMDRVGRRPWHEPPRPNR